LDDRDATIAKFLQAASGTITRTLDLGNGSTLELVRIPPGSFVMGDPYGTPDERPLAAVRLEKSFWMARFEVMQKVFNVGFRIIIESETLTLKSSP
jgi:formylglycine-generating enzyme required for sulfatase activity